MQAAAIKAGRRCIQLVVPSPGRLQGSPSTTFLYIHMPGNSMIHIPSKIRGYNGSHVAREQASTPSRMYALCKKGGSESVSFTLPLGLHFPRTLLHFANTCTPLRKKWKDPACHLSPPPPLPSRSQPAARRAVVGEESNNTMLLKRVKGCLKLR